MLTAPQDTTQTDEPTQSGDMGEKGGESSQTEEDTNEDTGSSYWNDDLDTATDQGI